VNRAIAAERRARFLKFVYYFLAVTGVAVNVVAVAIHTPALLAPGALSFAAVYGLYRVVCAAEELAKQQRPGRHMSMSTRFYRPTIQAVSYIPEEWRKKAWRFPAEV
jgi:hypothetical protein